MHRLMAMAIVVAMTICLASCSVHKLIPSKKVKRPKPELIQAALDSICVEGYNLYIAERVNWVSTDSLFAHYSIDDIGGSAIWQPTNNIWRVLFLDKEQKNIILDLRYDVKSEEQVISYDKRPITEMEQSVIDKKNKMLESALDLYGDSLRYDPDYGRPNFDFVRIDENTTRMYMLQGVERSGIIPFGNDFSVDFDNDGNPTAFRRYHHSLIATPNDGEMAMHSHLKDNPYITPTDVCNFQLYHGRMKQLNIFSTALDGFIFYNVKSNFAMFVTREVVDKINKDRP